MLYLFIVFYIPINEESLMGYGYYVEFYLILCQYQFSAFYFSNTFSWCAKLGSFEEWYFPVAFQSGPQGCCAVGQEGREREKSLSLWHFNDMYLA